MTAAALGARINGSILAALTAARGVHSDIAKCVTRFFDAAPPAELRIGPGGVAHVECTQLTDATCRELTAAMGRRAASRVAVDCLVWDDTGVERLERAGVPPHKIVYDFTELFKMPDLVSDSDSDAPAP